MRDLRTFEEMAEKYLPDACKLPFQFFYPTGKKQEKPPEPKYPQYYEEADIIAGDFHFMRQFMPARLDGKIVLTNTVTAANVEELRERGVEDASSRRRRISMDARSEPTWSKRRCSRCSARNGKTSRPPTTSACSTNCISMPRVIVLN